MRILKRNWWKARALVLIGAPYDSSDETVNVPETPNPLNRADMADLTASISHQEPSMHYGIEIYEIALHFVSSKLGCVL